MARPRSEDKHQAILQAATRLFAEEGLNAPTSRIAKLAGVSEGTVFTYFASKDDLMNQLYLELKGQLRAVLVLPAEPLALKEQVWLAWHAYVNWGIARPHEYQALAKLALAANVTEATRERASEAFCDVAHLLEEAMANGALRHQSVDFVGSLMAAMADATMNFIGQSLDTADAISRDGFTAFWKAIS